MLPLVVVAFTYLVFCFGRVPWLRSDRVAAAIIGAVAMLAIGAISLEDAAQAIDAPTIGLLFGMMAISAVLELSGAFSLVGFWVTRKARTPFALLVIVCVTSALLSAFLINDVVCIAFTPLVLRIARALDRDARPYLIALATSSNIGSVATITGNPQNILIGSLSHASYSRFCAELAPIAVAALAANVAIVWWTYRRALGGAFEAPARARAPRIYRAWVYKGAVVMGAVLVAFLLAVPPVLAALLGSAVVLVTRKVEPRRLYQRIDWTLLALFAGLFVVIAGAENAGIADRLLHALMPLGPDHIVGLTVITAVMSNLVSNVPAVMVLKSIIERLHDPSHAWTTLAMASTLAGNLTLPGSLATVIVVERAKREVRISFFEFARVGVPTALVSLALGVLWLSVR